MKKYIVKKNSDGTYRLAKKDHTEKKEEKTHISDMLEKKIKEDKC